MIFHRKRSNRQLLPIRNVAPPDGTFLRRRVVTYWRPDGSRPLVTHWKVVAGEAPS